MRLFRRIGVENPLAETQIALRVLVLDRDSRGGLQGVEFGQSHG
jgi:hypothetical protein